MIQIGEDLLFKILFVSAYSAFVGVRLRYRIPDAKEKGDRHGWGPGGWLMAAAILCLFACVGLYLASPRWYDWAQIQLPIWVRSLGLAGAILSTALVLRIHRTLGSMYSALLTIREGHRIVTTGPYARTRHPMYAVLYLFAVSLGLLSASAPMLLISIFLIVPFRMVAGTEEAMLIARFGNEYTDYMSRTGMFLPKRRSG